MKYKIVVKTIDIVEIDADGADAAIEKLKSQMDPRIVAGPITFEIIEVPKEDA
jgi:hypothetical protein